jgi:hypothetical protein
MNHFAIPCTFDPVTSVGDETPNAIQVIQNIIGREAGRSLTDNDFGDVPNGGEGTRTITEGPSLGFRESVAGTGNIPLGLGNPLNGDVSKFGEIDPTGIVSFLGNDT